MHRKYTVNGNALWALNDLGSPKYVIYRNYRDLYYNNDVALS